MSVRQYKYNRGVKPTIIRDDGEVINGSLVHNRKVDKMVIKGKRPKDKPNFKIRKQWFNDHLIYESEIDEYLEYIRPLETSKRVISHIIVEEIKPRRK